jgi:hypothetical protein
VLAASVASRISLEELNIQLYDPDSDIRAIEFIPELAAQQMHSCLADLKALRLRFCSKDWVFSDSTADSLVQLLELCPAVALLELRLGMRNKPSLFTAIAGVHMTALRDLELRWVNCTSDALAKILCRHQSTLKNVIFHDVHIREDRGWKLIFRVLRDKLRVNNLVFDRCSSGRRRVMFRNPTGKERLEKIQIQGDWDSLTSAMNRIVRVEDRGVRIRLLMLAGVI